MMPAPYGYCPTCKSPGKTRERRPDGNDTCESGHVYPSKLALGFVDVVMDEIIGDDPPQDHQNDGDVDEMSLAKIRHDVEEWSYALTSERAKVLLDEIDRLRKLVPPEPERGPGFVGQGNWSVFAEKVVEERDEARDEVKRLGAVIAAKKEHANVHFGRKGEFLGVDGFGPFNLKQVDKDRWEIHMLHEKVTLYNKKGHRVRGDHNYDGDW